MTTEKDHDHEEKKITFNAKSKGINMDPIMMISESLKISFG